MRGRAPAPFPLPLGRSPAAARADIGRPGSHGAARRGAPAPISAVRAAMAQREGGARAHIGRPDGHGAARRGQPRPYRPPGQPWRSAKGAPAPISAARARRSSRKSPTAGEASSLRTAPRDSGRAAENPQAAGDYGAQCVDWGGDAQRRRPRWPAQQPWLSGRKTETP